MINGIAVEQVSYAKFLGVLINENITWSNHITELITIVSKNIGVIHRVTKILPSDDLYSLYNTLIKPYFEYCNIVWATNKTVLFDKLFILQKMLFVLLLAVDGIHILLHYFKKIVF